MRFLMVDRICEFEKGKHVRGIKNISWDDDFLTEDFTGIPIFEITASRNVTRHVRLR